MLAGALLPLAFAPVGFFPIGFLMPLALFMLWERSTPLQAFRDGYWFGLAFFGVGVSWVFVSIHDMAHISLWLAGVITLLFISVLALFPAFQGYITARFFADRQPIHWILIFPSLWIVFEGVRGWVFTGFPWLYLGYSQMDSPLRGLAPIVGVMGVSFATAATGGLLLVLWRANTWRRKAIWALCLLLLWGGSALLEGVSWTTPNGKLVRVSMLQVAIPQQVRWRMEERQATIRRYVEMTQQHWDAQLIVWPENALTVFYHEATEFLDILTKEAQEHNVDLLIGLPYLDQKTQHYYNALVSLPGNQFYFKHHLVPFTEFLPLQILLDPLINFFKIPMSGFTPGSAQQAPIGLAGHRVGLSICYDAAFPEEIASALPAAEFLINVSNDGWFGRSLAPYQNLQMAQMRALETGRWLLRDTNTGISAFIGPEGTILKQSPLFQDDAITADVQPMIGMTPYARIGSTPLWGIVLLSLLSGGWLKRRQKTSYPIS